MGHIFFMYMSLDSDHPYYYDGLKIIDYNGVCLFIELYMYVHNA